MTDGTDQHTGGGHHGVETRTFAIAQIVFDPELSGYGELPKDAYTRAQALRSEWVIGIRGKVISRGTNKNPKLPTGEIEIHAAETKNADVRAQLAEIAKDKDAKARRQRTIDLAKAIGAEQP